MRFHAPRCRVVWAEGCTPEQLHTSGDFPISTNRLRLGEFVGTMALAQDNAFGQPLESQLRSCILATWMCETAGFPKDIRDTAYWVALLRYIGCTGHAHELATIFGDEIAPLGRSLVHDSGNPAEVVKDIVHYATYWREPNERDRMVQVIQQTVKEWAVNNFASGCEVADMFIQRLHFGQAVRDSIRFTYERWNGMGFPTHTGGDKIPLPMRVVHLSHDMEAIARVFSPERAIETARERRDRTYDPAIADLFIAHGADYFARLAKVEAWDTVLDLEPTPHHVLEGETLDEALEVAADFIDLKSPYMHGHSRRCAQLAADAAQLLGLSDDDVTKVRRAALLHDFGMTGVPNSIWDKPGSLTRAEFDRVELHPLLTEQMLRRTPTLAALNPIACAHHEKSDGSGYHKRVRADAVDAAAGVLAAVEAYAGMTRDRADRDALSADEAAAELRRLASEGVLDARATRAVLVAAGHGEPRARTVSRAKLPGGLSRREIDVLRLAARGLTTQQIADRLSIASKTADHHIQHIYTKIGVSTRAAAALWATQHALVI